MQYSPSPGRKNDTIKISEGIELKRRAFATQAYRRRIRRIK